MQIIKEQKIGDYYVSAVDISKDEWLEILKDETVSEKYKEAVICFYYMPDYKGSCVAVGNRLGKNAYSLVATIMNFGKYVQKRLGRFQVIDEDGKNTYWPIPMKQGKALSNKEEGNFEWTLRDELVEATKEYLMWYLMEKYKELRKEMPIRCRIDGVEYDELYKWELITVNENKTPFEIVQNHVINPNKANKGGFTNLIYVEGDNKTLKYLVDNKSAEFKEIIDSLAEDTLPLVDRLANYKASVASLLSASGFNSKANDERTAATILTCCNPDKYTFYKHDGMYDNLCKYLGEEMKPAGRCYQHYLDLIQPLATMASNDKELQDIVSPMIESQRKSDLLLAQDIVWMMLCTFPKRLGYLQHVVWPIRYWCVGYNFGGHESQLSRFLENSIWEGRFEEKNDKALLQRARQIRPKDILVLKASFTKGTGHKLSCIRVSALAEVKEIEEFEEDGFVGVRCKVDYFYRENKDFDGAKYGKYRKTIDECTDKDIMEFAIKAKDMAKNNLQNEYQKYIDLLKTNHNLILTGAPGTGKTHLAKEIAKEMGAETKFVQFHSSYDYTDFVEGLRPKNDDNGNVGFERKDGVFKAFCKRALKASFVNTVDNFDSVWNQLIKTLEENVFIEIPLISGKYAMRIELNENGDGLANRAYDNDKYEQGKWIRGQSKFFSKEQCYNVYRGLNGVPSGGHDTYRKAVVRYMKEKMGLLDYKVGDENTLISKPFVFIIDEINRGEISKIFGELFFSIDPGYRGEKGMVQTQYQNMIEEGDIFKKGFYVPENVYIIGTMNDIDRSVESMDFAMRRRFAWKEVTAEESLEAMKDSMTHAEEIKKRMTALNNAICDEKLGLNKSYQIGAAYFLKLDEYDGDFYKLWEYHLKGLLSEYLRGNRDAEKQLEQLKKAYDGNTESQNE